MRHLSIWKGLPILPIENWNGRLWRSVVMAAKTNVRLQIYTSW